MLSRLFQRKSLEQLQSSVDCDGHSLKKNLGWFELVMFGIGCIIGAGIFSAIGTAAAGNSVRPAAGPALVVSELITAVACGFTAMCYAEMASMIPVAGSAYTYAYATMGEIVAWIIGWDLLLEYAVSNVSVAISWGGYANSLLQGTLGISVPPWLSTDPRSALEFSQSYLDAHSLGTLVPATLTDAAYRLQPAIGLRLAAFAKAREGLLNGTAVFGSDNWSALSSAPVVHGFPITINLLAVVVILMVTWLCYIGIKESARANAIMVAIKLVILLVVIVIGAGYVHPSNWHPFAPRGFAGIQAGAAIIFFAFIGFDAVSTTAEECRDPGRDLPIGIVGSLVVCTVMYVLVTLVVTGMVSYRKLGVDDPLAYIFRQDHLTALSTLISFGAVIATTAVILVTQIGQPRILMAMSRDGLLGSWFAKVHPKYGTPANATLLTGVLVVLPAALMNIGEVVELTNIGTLFAFVLVCLAVMILRVTRPDHPRRFRVPFVWVSAPVGIALCVWLAWGLPSLTWIRFWIWLGVGLVIYFLYGRRRSRLSQLQR